MAVYSMTGFASVGAGTGPAATSAPDNTAEAPRPVPPGPALQVELRSVNSRFLDIVFRMPDDLRGLEPALRELLGQGLRRGKVEVRIATGREGDSAWPEPRPDQLNRLSRLESTIHGWAPKAQPLSVNEILHWCRNAPAAERPDAVVLETATRALAELKEARAREGARLADMLHGRVSSLRALAAKAAPLVGQVVQRQRERFIERWNEALTAAGGPAATEGMPSEALRDRALGEAAAYALRIDVAEELTRLTSHLDEIERLLKAGGELGKRLDFLIQELQREANTLGSKATAIELSAIAVDMKVLVEQMREQVQNIE